MISQMMARNALAAPMPLDDAALTTTIQLLTKAKRQADQFRSLEGTFTGLHGGATLRGRVCIELAVATPSCTITVSVMIEGCTDHTLLTSLTTYIRQDLSHHADYRNADSSSPGFISKDNEVWCRFCI